MDVSIRLDTGRFDNVLGSLGRRAPYAIAMALTRTAKAAKVDMRAKMVDVFDRPTPYTLNSLQVTPARRTRLEASLWFKERRGQHWLRPQVEGGARRDKASERQFRAFGLLGADQQTVPGDNAKLNAYGNMTGGQVSRILSALGASSDPLQNQTERSRKRGAARMFILEGLGVFERKGKSMLQHLAFVKRPRYRKLLPFEPTVRKTAARELIPQLEAAIAEAAAWR